MYNIQHASNSTSTSTEVDQHINPNVMFNRITNCGDYAIQQFGWYSESEDEGIRR
jgi:hypothetical protein